MKARMKKYGAVVFNVVLNLFSTVLLMIAFFTVIEIFGKF